MTEHRYRLPRAAQFVYERDQWVAYNGEDSARLALGPAELEECLKAASGAAVAAPEAPDRLVAGGLLARDSEDQLPYDRASWASRGWSAAYDFAICLYGSADPATTARPVGATAPFGVPRPVIEHYPPAPTAPPMTRDTLFACLREACACDAPPPVEVLVAAISVGDLESGWYRRDGGDWHRAAALPADVDFERLAPVAFGRAGYAVEALAVVAAIQPGLDTLMSRAYARLLVTGGSVLSTLEGAAGDAGLSSRGNYAVADSIVDWLGMPPGSVLLIGAVALGSR